MLALMSKSISPQLLLAGQKTITPYGIRLFASALSKARQILFNFSFQGGMPRRTETLVGPSHDPKVTGSRQHRTDELKSTDIRAITPRP